MPFLCRRGKVFPRIPMIRQPSRKLRWLGAALLLAAFVLGFLLRARHNMADFSVNYQAGQRLRVAETLYRVEDEHFMFKYLPVSAVLYAPLTYLPLETAKAVWYGVIVLCSVLLVMLAFQGLRPGKGKNFWVAILPCLVLLRYFFREWELGQINSLVTVVALLMIGRLAVPSPSPRRQAWAGAFWGLSICLKPYTVLFLPYLIVKRWWTAAAAGCLSLGVGLAFPALYYGWAGNWRVLHEWFTSLSRSTPEFLFSQDNISLFALFAKWTGSRSAALPLAVCAIVALAVFLLWMILRGSGTPENVFFEGAVLLLCIPLVSPLGWDYTLIMALPAVMLVVRYIGHFSRLWRALLIVDLLVVVLSLYDVLGPSLYASFMSWSVTTLNFLILLGFCVSLRARRLC